MTPTIVWFRQDLRLADNPALTFAAERGGAIYPLFIWAPEEEGDWTPGSASRYWLHHSLPFLDASLRSRGSRLLVERGSSLEKLQLMARSVGARTIVWNRRYEPAAVERDTRIKQGLIAAGIEAISFKSALLFEPAEVRTQAGEPFRVFTPFWRQCQKQSAAVAPLAVPAQLAAPSSWPASLSIESLQLRPHVDWAGGIRAQWRFGEEGAQAALSAFVAGSIDAYPTQRDRPDVAGVSRLSPYLHFGELTPRHIWAAVTRREQESGRLTASASAAGFLRQLGWREFAHHLLFHFPSTCSQPLREKFAGFPWREDAVARRRWQRGETGYPIVDAGMRQLWVTGWMHNRVRMLVASFLVKHLLLHWIEGARWFWDTLVDADLANNTLGWQWTAGCGADAAPYFRIFNPVTQAQRFDPLGQYVRRWVPELARLPDKIVHAPWRASPAELAATGMKLGIDYPLPVVDHEAARQRALAAWQQIRCVG